jgi:superfamily II DNA or RNA helicase
VEQNGIRSIITPCLATKIGHQFDMVLVDEAHLACNLGANVTQMLIRLQPKYRWALTATPIPNIVSNLFSLMGWIAVPDWYKGERRNAAWPYARKELGKFDGTFLCMERDFTEEHDRRRADPLWKGVCTKPSPVISSPARLLKLLKPSMAFIGKEKCNPKYIPPEIIDVRVPLGKEQAALYGYYLNRAHIPAKHPLIRARKQTAWLRGICADPAGFAHGGSATPKVSSNLNPKVIAILELTRDILARNEQVVIINSRVGLSDTLQHRLAEAGVSIARIDSTMPPEQHARQANLFKQRKAAVMLMGIKCAASHSFDQCVNEIIGSVEYSPGPFVQAQGRIDRVTNKVVKKIYCILHKDTIEEVMFDVVATKDDAATICLKGQRIPRDYKPVDGGEILATAMERFAEACSKPEGDCEVEWPKLREAIREASFQFLT